MHRQIFRTSQDDELNRNRMISDLFGQLKIWTLSHLKMVSRSAGFSRL